MPSFSAEQAEAVVHVVLTLLEGQLPVLSQFPSQFRAGFQVLWGLALGHSLGIFASFQVVPRVNPTRWVSLTRDLGFLLPVVVIDGLHELMEILQGNGLIMVHHFVFDTVS